MGGDNDEARGRMGVEGGAERDEVQKTERGCGWPSVQVRGGKYPGLHWERNARSVEACEEICYALGMVVSGGPLEVDV